MKQMKWTVCFILLYLTHVRGDLDSTGNDLTSDLHNNNHRSDIKDRIDTQSMKNNKQKDKPVQNDAMNTATLGDTIPVNSRRFDSTDTNMQGIAKPIPIIIEEFNKRENDFKKVDSEGSAARNLEHNASKQLEFENKNIQNIGGNDDPSKHPTLWTNNLKDFLTAKTDLLITYLKDEATTKSSSNDTNGPISKVTKQSNIEETIENHEIPLVTNNLKILERTLPEVTKIKLNTTGSTKNMEKNKNKFKNMDTAREINQNMKTNVKLGIGKPKVHILENQYRISYHIKPSLGKLDNFAPGKQPNENHTNYLKATNLKYNVPTNTRKMVYSPVVLKILEPNKTIQTLNHIQSINTNFKTTNLSRVLPISNNTQGMQNSFSNFIHYQTYGKLVDPTANFTLEENIKEVNKTKGLSKETEKILSDIVDLDYTAIAQSKSGIKTSENDREYNEIPVGQGSLKEFQPETAAERYDIIKGLGNEDLDGVKKDIFQEVEAENLNEEAESMLEVKGQTNEIEENEGQMNKTLQKHFDNTYGFEENVNNEDHVAVEESNSPVVKITGVSGANKTYQGVYAENVQPHEGRENKKMQRDTVETREDNREINKLIQEITAINGNQNANKAIENEAEAQEEVPLEEQSNEFKREGVLDFNIQQLAIPQFVQSLQNTQKEIDKTVKESERRKFEGVEKNHVKDVLQKILSGCLRKSLNMPILNLRRQGKLSFNNIVSRTHSHPENMEEGTMTPSSAILNSDTSLHKGADRRAAASWYKSRQKPTEAPTTPANSYIEIFKEYGVKAVSSAMESIGELNLVENMNVVVQHALTVPQHVVTLTERIIRLF